MAKKPEKPKLKSDDLDDFLASPELKVGTKVVVRPLWRRLIIYGLVLPLLIFLGGFGIFISQLDSNPMAIEDTPKADGITILTGGEGRLARGYTLLLMDKGKRLLVSGVDAAIPDADLKAELGVSDTIYSIARYGCCVDVDRLSKDTIANASATAEWVAKHDYNSVVVVTAAYHMPRALVELRAASPDTLFLPHPIQSDTIHLNDWWAWPGTTQLLVEEYLKFAAASIRALVKGLTG